MRKMKRTVSLLLAVLLVFTLSVTAMAAGPYVVTFEGKDQKVAADATEVTVKFQLSISENIDHFETASIELVYDEDILTLTEASKTSMGTSSESYAAPQLVEPWYTLMNLDLEDQDKANCVELSVDFAIDTAKLAATADGTTEVTFSPEFYQKDVCVHADGKRLNYGAGDISVNIEPAVIGLKGENEVTVTLDAGAGTFADGTKEKTITGEKGQPLGDELPTNLIPPSSDQEFGGWYTSNDPETAEEVTSETPISEDMPLYARWKTKDGYSALLNYDEHIAYSVGYDEGNGRYSFRPNNDITRAESATMIWRLMKDARRDELLTKQNSFTDMQENMWYNKAVSSMSNGKYINGYTDRTFRGDNKITRAEFMTIIGNFFDTEGATCNFRDLSSEHWAYEKIAYLTSRGWVKGDTDGGVRPDAPITRAEVAAILNRVLNRGVNAQSELGNYKSFTDNVDKGAWYYYEVLEAGNDHEYTGTRTSDPDGVWENWTKNSTDYVYDIEKYERP